MSAHLKRTHQPYTYVLKALLAVNLVCGIATADEYKVTTPPEQLKLNDFYKKYVSANGYPIVSSDKVSDYALKEAAWLVDMMLAKRPDVRQAMIQSGSRLIVMAHDEYTTDVPEHSKMKPKSFWDVRARGLGGSRTDPVCSCGEENLLAFPGDPYSTENILIHEFAHNIHLRGMVNIDPTFDERLKNAYESAKARGLWFGKYASTNKNEYFAEGVQSWFNNNRKPDHDHNHVDTRRELIEYDSALASLCQEVFGETEVAYTKPTTRLTGHLAGYDPAKAPTFKWPRGGAEQKARIRKDAGNRATEQKEDNASHSEQNVEGWRVLVDKSLLSEAHRTDGDIALRMLSNQLFEIAVRFPSKRVKELQTITIRLDRDHALKNMQYHPSRKWLSDNGYDPSLEKQVHIPQADRMVKLLKDYAQPSVVMHELAHAWHDQILGFNDPAIREAYRRFVESGDFEKVLHLSGRQRKHYALTNHKEFFAEMTEAWFGTNDFFPFVRAELKAASPSTAKAIQATWNR
ncbi:MAG: hypothetical protein AB8G99_18940 [Planctomycetaceae bacterium]